MLPSVKASIFAGNIIRPQPQITSLQQTEPAAGPATQRGICENANSEGVGGAAGMPAGSEDSSMSCPGMFTADKALTSSARQNASEAADTVSPGEKDSSEQEERKAEARLAALKTRKDAAAKDVKQYIDRW